MDYNPYRPQILGQEWVPIREENQVFSPAVNAVEVGHGFTLLTARQVNNARFYVNAFPPGRALGQTFLATIYTRGNEDETGPIERLIIPCNAALVSGGAVVGNTTDVVEALADPSDNKWVNFPTTGTPAISCHFPINQYIQILGGKRILDLTILYSMAVDQSGNTPVPIPIPVNRGVFSINGNNGFTVGFGVPELFESLVGANPISRCELGEIDFFWDAANTAPDSTSERLPWRFEGMQDFEISTSFPSRINFHYTHDIAGQIAYLNYIAMEVLYCEERRLVVGGKAFGQSGVATANTPYVTGANIITMRSLAQATNPILAVGDYSLVLSSANLGDAGGPAGLEDRPITLSQYPDLNALRELYDLPTMPGVQVNIPFPIADHVGDTFSQVVTHVLPQLSLHATGGTLTEPHVYGRQGAAQVWGTVRAEQEIYDDVIGVNTVYQQVRFYARRFGNTTDTLDFFGIGAMAGVTSPGITPAQFDALTEIIDGWKEVTLRFTNPPTLGTVANPTFRFEANTEVAGSRWEILAACAPAISGIPGNLLNQVPSADRLGVATYLPPAGATVDLVWMPQGVASPYVSGQSADPGCDAVLLFSQDPPTVTGIALSQLTQTVTGLGFNCGSLPCCIPSGIGYQRLTWSATSLPTSGFGGYELQRFDVTPGADFETIMLATSPTVTGFNDYEARVGLNSVYRIRSLNVYNFAGAWSTQVTGAPPAPGVTGGCTDNTGALIFTSNANQSGASNAAYVMQWESFPVEDFGLPEADMVAFQAMYGRDGVVAFHGTERGLETFSRTLLIHAAAIDPVRLADVKTLRDLAWADLPYICVRDEAGDRWYANVQVPTVNARFNRTQYMARVDIRELTRTPFAVNP